MKLDYQFLAQVIEKLMRAGGYNSLYYKSSHPKSDLKVRWSNQSDCSIRVFRSEMRILKFHAGVSIACRWWLETIHWPYNKPFQKSRGIPEEVIDHHRNFHLQTSSRDLSRNHLSVYNTVFTRVKCFHPLAIHIYIYRQNSPKYCTLWQLSPNMDN